MPPMTAWAIGEVFTVTMLLIVDELVGEQAVAPSGRSTTVWSATRKPTRAPGSTDLANEPR